MNEQKLMSLLGLGQKAGKLVSGEFAVRKNVQSGKARLILLATDCSENTKKSYQDLANYYGAQIISVLSTEQLGACIGRGKRAAVAVLDDGFKQALETILKGAR
jgi:ribosomal protein L7Ae-like RNA K-turn-binding protein